MKKILILFLLFIFTASLCVAKSEFRFYKKSNMTYKYNSDNEIVKKFKVSKNPENDAIYIEVMTKEEDIENKYRINYMDNFVVTKVYDNFGKIIMFYKSFVIPEATVTEIYDSQGTLLSSHAAYNKILNNTQTKDYIICDKYGQLKGLKEVLPSGKVVIFRNTACDVPYKPQ